MLREARAAMVISIIMAAHEGRYIHGNGAKYTITTEDGKVATFDLITFQVEEWSAEKSADYLKTNTPHQDLNVIEALNKYTI